MTPLFPDDHDLITIKQGMAGDCYLLASLDCILNGEKEGRDLVKSMFTQTETGVIVRVKRTAQSNHLKPENLVGKYDYYFDKSTNEDVFTLSNERLKTIDEQTWGVVSKGSGVQSNSLAVKILERISPYYYVGKWNPNDPFASVLAHNINNRHNDTSTVFLGNLVGIQAYDYTSADVESIIRLKKINPTQAVYMSMLYRKQDSHGAIHSRHALRLKEVIQTGLDSYNFVLANPWDNTVTELFSLEDIKKRKARYCIYSADAQRHQLEMMLTGCSEERGKFVFDSPVLFNYLLEIKKSPDGLSQEQLESYISVYQEHESVENLVLLDKVMPEKKLIEDDKQAQELNAITILRRFIEQANFDLLKPIYFNNPTDQKASLHLLQLVKDYKIPVSHDFMRSLVIETAAQFNCLRDHETIDSARNKIHRGLVRCYFSGDYSYLTRSMGLRDYFTDGVFPRSSITSLLSSEEFAAFVVTSTVLNSTSEMYIRNIQEDSIDSDFVIQLFSCSPSTNARDFFMNLQEISAINPVIVNKIIDLSKEQLVRVYGISFDGFIADIAKEQPSEFKSWFVSIQNAEAKLSLEQNALKLLEPVIQFPVHFDKANSIEEAERQGRERVEKLDKLRAQPEIIGALNTLCLLDPNAPNLIDEKIAEVVNLEVIDIRRINLEQEEIKNANILLVAPISKQFSNIETMVKKLEKNSLTNPNYLKAADTAKTFYNQLKTAHKNFIDGKLSLEQFKTDCSVAIIEAMPVLKEHRGWKGILDTLSKALLSLAQRLGANTTTGRWKFFEVKTESQKSVEGLSEELNKIKSPPLP
jgi:hypothetical protein